MHLLLAVFNSLSFVENGAYLIQPQYRCRFGDIVPDVVYCKRPNISTRIGTNEIHGSPSGSTQTSLICSGNLRSRRRSPTRSSRQCLVSCILLVWSHFRGLWASYIALESCLAAHLRYVVCAKPNRWSRQPSYTTCGIAFK